MHPQLSGPAGVVDERRQPQVRFSSTDTQYQAEQVGGHGAVGVGPFDEEHAEQLREDDDVNQVWAQVPQTVHGPSHQRHHCRQAAKHEDGDTHHPHDLTVWCLGTSRNIRNEVEDITSENTTHWSFYTEQKHRI